MNGHSIAQATLEAAQLLRRAGVPEPRREAASLLAHVIARDRTFIITHAETTLTPSDIQRFRQYVERRATGEPLQYITGHQEFFSLDFEVTPDVLIPRPETELLVETALDLLSTTSLHPNNLHPDNKSTTPLICDVGTGSGCIAITILHERPATRALGLDISTSALRIAARNALRHRVNERLTLVASDCFAALDPNTAPRFSLIISNPPYVASEALAGLQREVRDHEPLIALSPGPDGLHIIRRLLSDAPHFLLPSGHLLLEIGFDQHPAVQSLIDPQVWTLLDAHKDLQGIPRTVVLKRN